ncbi:hypothetical protein EI555_004008 [Monodon monoceros]|uniref:Uncharacterized protein n=1 Tax=Monodon monoceros TaxID=40151 RepID=A0A4U1F5L3_MONMO|nr:hypothetical protein EI555_004008 [Monodon monoceros]
MWLLGNEEHRVSPASLRAPGSQVKSLAYSFLLRLPGGPQTRGAVKVGLGGAGVLEQPSPAAPAQMKCVFQVTPRERMAHRRGGTRMAWLPILVVSGQGTWVSSSGSSTRPCPSPAVSFLACLCGSDTDDHTPPSLRSPRRQQSPDWPRARGGRCSELPSPAACSPLLQPRSGGSQAPGLPRSRGPWGG